LIGFDSKRVFKPIELKKYEDTFKYFDRSGVGLIKKEGFQNKIYNKNKMFIIGKILDLLYVRWDLWLLP